jgi:hypothetical protein
MLRPHIAKYSGAGDGRGNDEVIWIAVALGFTLAWIVILIRLQTV